MVELAKQKKALEDKRNFVNQVPAGGFKKAFGEHEINYKLNKDKVEAEIAKKREDEKAQLKNHYGSLKFKPKKSPLIIGPNEVSSGNPNGLSADGLPKDISVSLKGFEGP